ncbi:hypothetical protein NUU61_000484 [Penicillium alfredii]|uniref:Uncharacterized protein n=1 Tax=Penicillium alfredii TaxID=1506179 RepID=A0A9W9GB21_9EURO|nr:uncharacterized protein NUU61_000484 [Penicillium alfredii]KAJ5114725.1 hypothetical protein NUU61_000484 [Penicillium alfredii]
MTMVGDEKGLPDGLQGPMIIRRSLKLTGLWNARTGPELIPTIIALHAGLSNLFVQKEGQPSLVPEGGDGPLDMLGLLHGRGASLLGRTMSAVDGASKRPNNPCFPARIQTHIRNQGSNSSSISQDAMPADIIPSPRRWSPTYQPRRSRQPPTSLSFVPPPAVPRSDSHEQSPSLSRRPADRGPVCISPFRSVRRMKEPFPLMLPTSPVSLDGAPPLPERPIKASKPPAGHTLRTWRSDQNLTSASMEAFGLFPGSPISESRPASAGADQSFSEPKFVAKPEPKPEPEKPAREDIPPIEKIEDKRVRYKAYRPPERDELAQDQRRTDVTNVHEAHSNLVRQCESTEPSEQTDPDRASSVTSPEPAPSEKESTSGSSPRIQRPRTATGSSGASWVPSTFSYCQRWLHNVPFDTPNDHAESPKEFNRRKCQIVEKDPPMPPLDIIPGAKALEAPVRLAVASKTKPKLVDIARQSSPSIPLPPSLLPKAAPATPDQRQEEVSAFSPDTPQDMSDSGYGTRDSRFSLESYTDSKDDDAYTDPGSLTSDSVTSTVVCERSESAQGERATSPKPEIRSGSVSPKGSSPSTDSPGRTSNASDKDDLEKQRLWDDEWTLDELDHSVKDFPRHMLRLESPVMVFLRNSDEKALVRPFRAIFPNVAENLLDGLCAALIARNYLVTLSNTHRRKPSASTRNDTYAVDAVPTKAYSTLGIQLPSGSPSRIKDRVLGSRSMELRREFEKIVDNLLFAICGRADETLKSAVEVLADVLETNAQR